MKCRDFADLLEQYLGGQHHFRPLLEEHAADCPACQTHLVLAQRLLTLPAQPPVSPSPQWTEAVVAAVLRDQGRRAWRRRLAVAAAAGVLLVGLVTTATRWGQPPQQPQLAVAPPPVPTATPASGPGPAPELPWEQTALHASLAWTQLKEASLRGAQDTSRQLAAWTRNEPDRHPLVQPPSPDWPELTRSVSDSLEPVVRSTRRAFHAWRGLVPPVPDEPGLSPSGDPP
jgi:hypothetical protein